MPSDLCALSEYVASCVGFSEYKAEAAIINFYPIGTTLAGHVDRSEFDHLSPIVSIRFVDKYIAIYVYLVYIYVNLYSHNSAAQIKK